MEDKESIINELKMFKAHASEMQKWADKIIKKLEGDKPVKKSNRLTEEDHARLDARLYKKMYK